MVRSQPPIKAMRISEFASEGGVGVETVRYYQRKGLLAAPAGGAPAGRHYDAEDLRLLRQCAGSGTGPCPIIASFE